MLETPYYINYSPTRMVIHSMVTSKYFDLAISAVIGLNVITMAMEFYMMPKVMRMQEIKKCIQQSHHLFPISDSGQCIEVFQLLLHCRVHFGGWNEDLCSWIGSISQ